MTVPIEIKPYTVKQKSQTNKRLTQLRCWRADDGENNELHDYGELRMDGAVPAHGGVGGWQLERHGEHRQCLLHHGDCGTSFQS